VSGRRILAPMVAALALAASPASAQETDQMRVFQRYADIRERLLGCQLEVVWDTLTPESARRCRRLKRRYLLYASPGESWFYHVHCRTRRCIRTPYGEPPADGPMPADAHVYR
jgi:hypothetical protein